MFSFAFMFCNLDLFCVCDILAVTSYFQEFDLRELLQIGVKSESKEHSEKTSSPVIYKC